MSDPNTDKIQIVLHEKAKQFSHNYISPAERWACIGRAGASMEDGEVEPFIILDAARHNGILYLNIGPTGMGCPALN